MPQCPATFTSPGGLLYCIEEQGHSGSHRTVNDPPPAAPDIRQNVEAMRLLASLRDLGYTARDIESAWQMLDEKGGR